MHTNDFFEYLLGDPGYMDEEMFVMHNFGRHELHVVHAYHKMHVGYEVQMEWGIGGLKRKWKRFMKHFNFTKPKYNHLFKTTTILIISYVDIT
jgi:hypothetical protein